MSQGVFKVISAMQRKAYFAACGLFSPGFDLSWIPTINNLTYVPPIETPNGSRVSFTWDTPPKSVTWNGQTLYPGTGYLASGNGATFAVPPVTGDIIQAIL